MSQILQSPLSLSKKDSISGPVEFDAPSPERRPFIPNTNETRREIKPHWWEKIYHRNSKNIESHIWSSLMDPVEKDELHQTIKDLL
jgi:hypothetical protein